MTKEYDEYKNDQGKRKASRILIKVLGTVVILGLALLAVSFFLMLLFPARCGEGWVGLFNGE